MAESLGRSRQKLRTRKELLEAAAQLMKHGRKPSLEEVAEQALVSRATAYRYFPSIEALYLEATIDIGTPHTETVFGAAPPQDVVARLKCVDGAFHTMMAANEPQLRMMLAQSLERSARSPAGVQLPVRQNRRTPLIEAALEPVRGTLKPAAMSTLKHALALVIGPESMMVLKDVLQLDDADARKVRQWAIRALVHAAVPAAAVPVAAIPPQPFANGKVRRAAKKRA